MHRRRRYDCRFHAHCRSAFERGASRRRRAGPSENVHRPCAALRLWRNRALGHAARGRDAARTLLGVMDAGFYDEAESWREWLIRAVAGSPEQAQIMYGIAGERRLTELEVPWLPGYEGSRPVRIGNAACSQLQLDTFGEVSDALYQARCKG